MLAPWGDIEAITSGDPARIVKRVERKLLGRLFGQLLMLLVPRQRRRR